MRKTQEHWIAATAFCLWLPLLCVLSAQGQSGAGIVMVNDLGQSAMNYAVGTFDVKVTPAPLDDRTADPMLGRMLLDKQFHGASKEPAKEKC